MIDGNLYEGYDLICDICGHTVTGLECFEEALEYKKENGWIREYHHSGEWEDVCPECQEQPHKRKEQLC